MRDHYRYLAAEGLTNMAMEPLGAITLAERRYNLYCNNERQCAKRCNHRSGAFISVVTHPHKHRRCPKCNDPRVIIALVGED